MTNRTDASDPTASARPPVVNSTQLANELGFPVWMVKRAQELGLVSARDKSRGWSRAVADEVAARAPQIREAIEDREGLGAHRLAEELSASAGCSARKDDVLALSGQGFLRVVGEYNGFPMYSVKDARALSSAGREALAEIVRAREEHEARQEARWQAWAAVSMKPADAADRLGWRVSELEKVAAEGAISAGLGGRYATADLDVLAADEEVRERVCGDRLIGSDAACGLLEIRPSDWKYVLDAGWITPSSYVQSQVGSRRWIDVPLFTTRDVEVLRDLPGVPWEEVRAVRPGTPSPLREFVRRQPGRAELVHGFAGALADRHQVEVWAHHDERTGSWELDWMRDEVGNPGVGAVRAELWADAAVARFASDIRLGDTLWGRLARWARPLLVDGAGVVLCTRTSGPSSVEGVEDEVVEVAVVDVASGAVLLDRPVRPGSPLGERRVHGISDADLERALPWEKVLPMVRRVTRGRLIVPCRPERDRGSISADTERSGKRLMHLGAAESWALPPQERPLESVAGWPARRGAESVREALVRLAKGRGRSHVPQDAGSRG
ncbi:hypothetical protein [Streptomyces violascens]|uniref:hypothetical protein n=1 Tax=Streptomyces violascens TaxID=67381 RepID=UPI00167480E2|nr:hypothetical protein [Streptomyces violascens]GGU40636.1 hypothetical protein GCM10010289_71960 [Streptomyces violascens]